MKRVISLTLSIFLLLGCVLPVFAADGVPTSVMEATKSVVRILSVYSNGSSTGSGFVIKNESGEVLIVTNDHVVEGNPYSVSVWISETRKVKAEIVFTVPERDLCVLKLKTSVDMKPLKLSREEPQHGAAIYAVGFPGAGDILSDKAAHTSDSATITDGIISAIRNFTIVKGGKSVKLLQVNAAINSGNSGGPLFNKKGEVIGINTYKVNAESQGVFGSVAVSELLDLLEKHNIEIPEAQNTISVNPVWIAVGGVVLVFLLIVKKRRSKPKTSSKKEKKSQETENLVTLSDYVRRWPSGLGIGRAVSLLLPAAIQLRNLHNDGKLHLQISPDTILVNSFGKETSLKEPAGQETARFNSGFAAPEIYKGAGFGIASDVYSFGAVLYYVVTGRIPSNSLQQELLEQDFVFLPEEGFAAVIRKAMAFETFSRTQSMQELIYGISAFTAVSRTAPAKVQAAPMKKAEIEGLLPKKQEVSVPVRQQKAEADRLTDIVEKEAKSRASLQTEAKKPVVTAAPEKKPEPAPKKKSRKWIPVTIVLGLVCAASVLLMQKEAPVSLQEKPAASAETSEAVQLSPEALKYNEAVDFFKNKEYGKAAIAFAKLGDFRDAREISFRIWDVVADRRFIDSGHMHTVGVKADGTVVSVGSSSDGRTDVGSLADVVAITAGQFHTIALHADGTVSALGDIGRNTCEVDDWTNIVQVLSYTGRTFAGGIFGLKSDGTLVATHDLNEMAEWHDLIAFDFGIGLKSDGTVIQVKNPYFDVTHWNNITAISRSGAGHIIGLKSDGTVMATGVHYNGTACDCDVSEWNDIIAVSAGTNHLLGLKSDGTVVAAGANSSNQCNVDTWTDIVAIRTGNVTAASYGIKSDGTVVTAGSVKLGNVIHSEWNDIKLPADRDSLLAAIEVNYITDTGDDSSGRPDAEEKPTVDISENILMGLGLSEEESRRIGGGDHAAKQIAKLPLFNTEALRKNVSTITFLDTMEDVPTNAVDASALGNGKVKAWAEQDGDLYDVYVAAEGGVLAPKDCSRLFSCMPNLTSIDFGNAFDTSKVTSMGSMFGYCKKLKALDLSSFDTSNVSDMGGTFYECFELESLNVTSFDTSNVTSMQCMFYACKRLKTLDVTRFNTSKVTNMQCMFLQCSSLKELNLSSFDVSNVTDAFNMFYKCPVERPEWYNHTMD